MHESEEVLTKLVYHEVLSKEIYKLDDDSEETCEKIKEITYTMIASLESTSEEIYEDPKSL